VLLFGCFKEEAALLKEEEDDDDDSEGSCTNETDERGVIVALFLRVVLVAAVRAANEVADTDDLDRFKACRTACFAT
jgi:hypothetical protein